MFIVEAVFRIQKRATTFWKVSYRNMRGYIITYVTRTKKDKSDKKSLNQFDILFCFKIIP